MLRNRGQGKAGGHENMKEGGRGGKRILSARSHPALPGSACPGLERLLLSSSVHGRWQPALPKS